MKKHTTPNTITIIIFAEIKTIPVGTSYTKQPLSKTTIKPPTKTRQITDGWGS